MIFKNNERIVFAGDSVTDMGSEQSVAEGNGLGFGYVRYIDSFLGAYYPEINLRVTNSGVSGNNSRELLKRYDSDVVSLNADWVCICIGINDVWRQFDMPYMTDWAVGVNEYEQNVEKMILSVKDDVKGVFVATPYYIEPNTDDLMRKRMNEYGRICKKLAEKYDCRFVDFQKVFDEYCRFQHSSRIAWDRVHPNQIGSLLMAREFLKQCEFEFNR